MRGLWLVAWLALVGSAVAGPAVLTPDQMRAFGLEAVAKGFADQALEIAQTLLTRDAGDSGALVLKAQALRVLRRFPESEAAARAGWAAAKDASQRYAAATAVAQALSLEDHRTEAQFWLRQAVQNAPNQGAKAQAVADFNYVRSQNPLTLQFDASIRPSNNVNNGARDPFFHLGPFTLEIPGGQRALSGVVGSFGLSGDYKLAETQGQTTKLTFSGSSQMVLLSQAAHRIAPEARNSAYAYQTLNIGLSRKMQADPATTVTISVALGHDWYGGSSLSNHQNLEFGAEHAFSADILGFADLSLQRQNRLDSKVASSTAVDLSFGVGKQTADGDVMRLTLTLDRTNSAAIGVDHTSMGANLDWQHAQPVLGTGLAGSVGLSRADYRSSSFTSDGRHDVQVTATLSATLNKLGYLGFSPVMAINYARNTSNIVFNDTQTIGLSLSVKSRF